MSANEIFLNHTEWQALCVSFCYLLIVLMKATRKPLCLQWMFYPSAPHLALGINVLDALFLTEYTSQCLSIMPVDLYLNVLVEHFYNE